MAKKSKKLRVHTDASTAQLLSLIKEKGNPKIKFVHDGSMVSGQVHVEASKSKKDKNVIVKANGNLWDDAMVGQEWIPPQG